MYQLTNLVNGKIYIGCHVTSNVDDDYMGSGTRLKYAKRKYGVENFKKEILSVHETPEEMFAEEKRLVSEEFVGREDVYNLKVGGLGGWGSINQTLTFEQRQQISKAGVTAFKKKLKIDQNFFQEHAKRSSIEMKKKHAQGKFRYDTFKGKHHTDEAKKKISEANRKMTGSKNSQHGTAWVTDGYKAQKIKLLQLDEFLSKGWKRGRSSNMR